MNLLHEWTSEPDTNLYLIVQKLGMSTDQICLIWTINLILSEPFVPYQVDIEDTTIVGKGAVTLFKFFTEEGN